MNEQLPPLVKGQQRTWESDRDGPLFGDEGVFDVSNGRGQEKAESIICLLIGTQKRGEVGVFHCTAFFHSLSA